ncbi:hypothetical protein [Candidatus Venteria ishoeyi]|uniref:Uncharacterized protein n=1 Tax=Candidatus Venteria ishoeyi TaxID=1899563 RepID=A0A1H6F9V8_9GAMM|nr:hypothetical protein [Candidatus Venteria ishoeyi]MDM8545757.1 hypothetical protein [Candidatus Venteria ishoeyi]SEH06890.1 Uncharacterised protein [Candidatus Venteria ishoeyi]
MMEAIRKIETVEDGQVHVDLPKQFWGKEVEIIVLSTPQQVTQPIMRKKSLRSCLKRYAKPDLISQKKDAWQ